MGRIMWAAAAVVAVVTGVAALLRPAEIRLADLHVYVGAVGGLSDGASLYDFIRGDAPFTYPPFAAMLFGPLTWLPLLPLQVLWTAATIAIVAGLAKLAGRQHAGLLALVLFLSAPVSSDLRYGQVSLFLAGFIMVDVLLLRRTPWFGSLIGIAAAVKLTPLIFIPMLWLAGRRTAALTATATFAGCAAVAALVLPGDSWRFWTDEVFHVSRLGHITSAGNQSLNGMLLRFDLPDTTRSALVLAIGGTVAAIALWRSGRLARDGDWLSATIVVGAASIVLSPVSWTHHQIWLVLAALLPLRTAGSRAAAPSPAAAHVTWTWGRGVWAAVVLAVMLLPVTALGGPVWTNARLLLAIVISVGFGLLSNGRAAAGPRAATTARTATASPPATGARTATSARVATVVPIAIMPAPIPAPRPAHTVAERRS